MTRSWLVPFAAVLLLPAGYAAAGEWLSFSHTDDPLRIVYTTDSSADPAPYRDHCEALRGEFRECGSTCGPGADGCIAVCAYTCEDIKEQPTQVPVPAAMRMCETDMDCMSAEQSCSSCCDYIGINIASKPAFDQQRTNICDKYINAICDCYNPKTHPACVGGFCELQMQPQPQWNMSGE
jgi:hypothetical protein